MLRAFVIISGARRTASFWLSATVRICATLTTLPKKNRIWIANKKIKIHSCNFFLSGAVFVLEVLCAVN